MSARRRAADQQELDRLQAELVRRETIQLVAGAIHLRGHDPVDPDTARELVEASASRLGVPIDQAHATAIADGIMDGSGVQSWTPEVEDEPEPAPVAKRTRRQAARASEGGQRTSLEGQEGPSAHTAELLDRAAAPQLGPAARFPVVVITEGNAGSKAPEPTPPEQADEAASWPPIAMRVFLRGKTFEDLRAVYRERGQAWTAEDYAAALADRWAPMDYLPEANKEWSRGSLDRVLRQTWRLSWTTFRKACEA